VTAREFSLANFSGSVALLSELSNYESMFLANPKILTNTHLYFMGIFSYNIPMKYKLQYAVPTTKQKLELNLWLRICQYWFNRQLGDRFDWWEYNRSPVNACPLVTHLPELRHKPN